MPVCWLMIYCIELSRLMICYPVLSCNTVWHLVPQIRSSTVLRGLFSLFTPKKHSWAKFASPGGIFYCFWTLRGPLKCLLGEAPTQEGDWVRWLRKAQLLKVLRGLFTLKIHEWAKSGHLGDIWWYFQLLLAPEKDPWDGEWMMHPLKRVRRTIQKDLTFVVLKGAVPIFPKK